MSRRSLARVAAFFLRFPLSRSECTQEGGENSLRESYMLSEQHEPGTWQLHPPKPSLQWQTESRQTPFWHAVPSGFVQSSVKRTTTVISGGEQAVCLAIETASTRNAHGERAKILKLRALLLQASRVHAV